MNDTDNLNRKSHFMTGMVLGTILGGVIAYIYSSPDGKKKARKFIDEGSEMLSEIMDKTQPIRTKTLEKVTETTEDLEKQVRKAHNDSQNEIQSIGAHLKQRFFKKNGKKIS